MHVLFWKIFPLISRGQFFSSGLLIIVIYRLINDVRPKIKVDDVVTM